MNLVTYVVALHVDCVDVCARELILPLALGGNPLALRELNLQAAPSQHHRLHKENKGAYGSVHRTQAKEHREVCCSRKLFDEHVERNYDENNQQENRGHPMVFDAAQSLPSGGSDEREIGYYVDQQQRDDGHNGSHGRVHCCNGLLPGDASGYAACLPNE